MQYKTYLFDFDYTLANSENGIVTCFEKLLEKNHYSPKTRKEITRTIGLSIPEAISILTGQTEPKAVKLLQCQYSIFANTYMTKNTRLYPAAKSVLAKLKQRGCRTGIISNKTGYRIQETLEEANITHLIDVIVGSERAKAPKPAPDSILQALKELRIDKRSALYIGDSLIDAQAAESADIDFAAVLTGVTPPVDFFKRPHVKLLQSLDELI